MNSPLISVIIPVYNVEKYLEKCVISVLRQTFTDFEILLIDDASPDTCPLLCDNLAKEDERIKVFHLEKNGGVSNARNVGIEKANGEYILFLDSDDYIEDYLFEKLAAAIKANPADVSVFGLIEEYYDKNGEFYKENVICPEEKHLTDLEQIRREAISLEATTLYGYPWNKLYKASLIRESGVRFEKMGFNEDIIFNIKLFYSVKSLNLLGIAPYHYAKRFGSTTGKFIPTYHRDIMYKIKELYIQFESFGILDHNAMRLLASEYVRYTFSALERNLDPRSKLNSKKRIEFFEKHIDTNLYKNLKPYFPTDSLIGIMAATLKAADMRSAFLIARIIYLIKKFLPKLFSSIN